MIPKLKRPLQLAAGVVALGTAAGLVLRVLSKRHSIPCPSWLVPLLENPYVSSLAGTELLLDRAGVQPGMRVLDVGCGPGRVTIPAARRVGPGGCVTALDIQSAMIERLEKRLVAVELDNVHPVVADISVGQLELEPNRFDRVFLVAVLGEIPARQSALRQIHSALKDDGLLSVTEIFPDPHYQTRASLRRMAEKAGFRVVSCSGSWISYTMNLCKEL